jgi:dolichyl-phosphate-mannose-protein mannosyltransferase
VGSRSLENGSAIPTAVLDAPPNPSGWSGLDTISVALVTAAAGVLRLIGLTTPRYLYFDEYFYAQEACYLVHHSKAICGIGQDAVTPHPPLGKWLISLGIRAFGNAPLGWRIGPAIAGTLTVLLLYVLARRLLGSTLGALIASGLLAIDLLHFVQSRIGMLDVFATLFVVASFLFLVIDRDRTRPEMEAHSQRPKVTARPWLIAAGLSAGAAAATKWVGFLLLATIWGLVLAWDLSRHAHCVERQRLRHLLVQLRTEARVLLVALAVAPALIYVLSFTVSMDGVILAWPWSHGSWVRNFLGTQKYMLLFHLKIADVSPYSSPAWSWPLVRRPVVYFFNVVSPTHSREILALGSPFVWWTSLVALGSIAVIAVRRRSVYGPEVVILGGFLGLYVPWLAISTERSFTFLFYLLPAVPFMVLSIAYVAVRWSRSMKGRVVVGVFCAGAIAFFVFFYPVVAASELSDHAVRERIWFTDCRARPGSITPDGWCWK